MRTTIKNYAGLLLLLISISVSGQTFTGKVVTIIDGNTFEIIDDENEVTKFMLSEVDCPEIGQELAEEAMAFVEKLILKKKVEVERTGKDRWGNKLAIIRLKNGTVVHEELVKAGLAWASQKASNEVNSMEEDAKSNKSGIWKDEEPTAPWIYRRQQTMMQPKSR